MWHTDAEHEACDTFRGLSSIHLHDTGCLACSLRQTTLNSFCFLLMIEGCNRMQHTSTYCNHSLRHSGHLAMWMCDNSNLLTGDCRCHPRRGKGAERRSSDRKKNTSEGQSWSWTLGQTESGWIVMNRFVQNRSMINSMNLIWRVWNFVSHVPSAAAICISALSQV